ncbi:MAG: hypothetical protein ACT4OO_00750 [Nitrospiraceae bacterium]
MPLIWCSISGHGFGHAAQMVPVLNQLGSHLPHLTALLHTTVPASFFHNRLTITWERFPIEQDIGCVQQDPLKIDVEATWTEHQRFHREWNRKLAEEEAAIRAHRPDLVFSDISYLAIEAGARAGVKAIALGSLSWDLVLMPFVQRGNGDQQRLIESIQCSYSHAQCLLRPTPGLSMEAFPRVIDIGPIAEPARNEAARLREAIGAAATECMVLVGFGGISMQTLPFAQMEQMTTYRFVVDGPVPGECRRVHSASALPLSFKVLLASADLVITKPGYGTITEAVTLHKPVVYVRRYNFADEQSLVDYLHRYGRGAELSTADFFSGNWKKALESARAASQSLERPPAPTGAADAAALLATYLRSAARSSA